MKNKTFAGFAGIVVVLISGYFLFGGSLGFDISLNNNDLEQAELEFMEEDVEEESQYESLPTDPVTYDIAQAKEQWPKFLEATVNPPKVEVGDIQKMKVVVQSPSGIDSVVANIGTDNGTTTISLEKTGVDKSAYVPRIELENNKVVKVRSVEEADKLAEKANSGLIVNEVIAQEYEKEVWEGEWEVHDTHTKTYTTEFLAIDNEGNEGNIEVQWLDPICSIPVNGNWNLSETGNCYLYDGIHGVASSLGESGTATIGGSGTLVVGDGSSPSAEFVAEGGFTLSGGSIALSSDGSLNLSDELCVGDGDGDGWPASNGSSAHGLNCNRATGDSCPTWSYGMTHCKWEARSLMSSWETDCHEELGAKHGAPQNDSEIVHPGQNSYFTSSGGNGWDYNCSGSAEKRWGAHQSSCTDGGVIEPKSTQKETENKISGLAKKAISFLTSNAFATHSPMGWSTSVAPSCGSSSRYYTGLDDCTNSEYRIQECH